MSEVWDAQSTEGGGSPQRGMGSTEGGGSPQRGMGSTEGGGSPQRGMGSTEGGGPGKGVPSQRESGVLTQIFLNLMCKCIYVCFLVHLAC